jgi:hypothetical protein
MRPQVQPLWTWPAALLLAALALLAAHVAAGRAQARYLPTQMNLARLQAEGSVVMLGSSKVRCGVLFDADMSAALAARGAPAPFVRLSLPAAPFDDLSPAFDALDRGRPRMVLLDADYLTLEPYPYRRAEEASGADWRQRTRAGLKLMLTGDAGVLDGAVEYNIGPRAAAACRPAFVTRRTPAAYAHDLAGRRTSTAAERRKVLNRLDRLKAGGATVVLVQTPRSPAYAAAFPQRLDHDARAILRREAAAHGFEVLSGAPPIPAGDFLDAGHMNGAGQATFSAWLADRIAAALKQGAAA